MGLLNAEAGIFTACNGEEVNKLETLVLLYCTLSLAAQCIVIGPICVWVCLWVCYHDNSKLLKH